MYTALIHSEDLNDFLFLLCMQGESTIDPGYLRTYKFTQIVTVDHLP